ncbi:MAG: hypothetical protein AB7S78_09020 [Candidatus Omnitrophota bacterium]
MTRCRQIFGLYFLNTNFMLLSGVLLFNAAVSKFLFATNHSGFAEDFSTLLFVATLWLTFYFGLMIKRQFANHRASLWPGYRRSHLCCLVCVYLFFLLAAVAWVRGLRPLFEISTDGLQGMFVTCFLASLLIAYLGYLSIGRVFIYSYVLGLVMAVNVTNIIAAFETITYLKYIAGLSSGVFIVFFLNRLAALKEHHFEYHYLLSWPPKHYFINQLKSEQFITPLKRFLNVKEGQTEVPAYPREANVFSRAFHWDYADHTDIKIVGMLIILGTPVYLLFIKSNPAFADFFRNAYSNFLLLSMTPVLVVIGSHYKKLDYAGHDLLKPVAKPQYIKERGLVLIAHWLTYWIIFSVCFALLPNIVFQPDIYLSAKFWGYLLLTGNVSFLVTAWLAWLSCSMDSRVVIINGIILSSLLIFQFYYASTFAGPLLVWNNVICLGAGLFLFRCAYWAWCRKEFI